MSDGKIGINLYFLVSVRYNHIFIRSEVIDVTVLAWKLNYEVELKRMKRL